MNETDDDGRIPGVFPESEFRRLLHAHPIPEGVRERILTAVRAESVRWAAETPGTPDIRPERNRRRRRWFLVTGISAAAGGLLLSGRWRSAPRQNVRTVGPELLMMTAVTRFDEAMTNRIWGVGRSMDTADQRRIVALGDWPQQNFGPYPQACYREEPDFCGQTALTYDLRCTDGIRASLYSIRAITKNTENTESGESRSDVALRTTGLPEQIPERAMYPTAGRAAAAWAEPMKQTPALHRVFVLVVAGQPDDYRQFLAPQITGTIG
ncbi:MAG: hypothetical protein Q4C47_02505 [Planctomycetia bacterium]|nr:hypothetical protein [Planctomycetia bacterium]